jgi:hypothetical protein
MAGERLHVLPRNTFRSAACGNKCEDQLSSHRVHEATATVEGR